MHALVTGGAGFIGSHLVDSLLFDGWQVTTLDNFDPFYDSSVKRTNIAQQIKNPAYQLIEADIRDAHCLKTTLCDEYDVIVHLAARAGVRPSILDPVGYQDTNVKGTQNLLEFTKEHHIKQFVFASSSSVYGVNPNVPWREDDHVLQPISPYASTKVSGELLGHVYSYLYGMRFIGLRFFTVYGPRQRPDLAIHKFAQLMLKGDEIPVFGDGSTRRDYTFVADIVHGIRAAMTYDKSNYEIINLGNNRTVSLKQLITSLENALGIAAKYRSLPTQPGDVPQTWADISKAHMLLGYQPQTSLEQGLACFADWLRKS
ncbi:MAG TPA: GDP-mannose 4,6-dehydratase [Armatimonadota bacterium]|nr:GDP-mannose 4,6-dehydratase [Armatimonadota bacterium]